MLGKFASVAVGLSLVLVALAPVLLELFASGPVLAQDGYERVLTPQEAQEQGLVYVDPNRVFDCGFLNGDPANGCVADANGFYTTRSGVKFPVGKTEAESLASFLQYGGIPGSEPPTGPSS